MSLNSTLIADWLPRHPELPGIIQGADLTDTEYRRSMMDPDYCRRLGFIIMHGSVEGMRMADQAPKTI